MRDFKELTRFSKRVGESPWHWQMWDPGNIKCPELHGHTERNKRDSAMCPCCPAMQILVKKAPKGVQLRRASIKVANTKVLEQRNLLIHSTGPYFWSATFWARALHRWHRDFCADYWTYEGKSAQNWLKYTPWQQCTILLMCLRTYGISLSSEIPLFNRF